MSEATTPLVRHEDAVTTGWQASLDLAFERRGERTVIARRAHRGPLQIQRAFYPEGPTCPHVYVLHPPGGLVAADEIDVNVEVGPTASALLTTPAATKIYRARTASAPVQQRQIFHVGPAATCEWLPNETIAYAGARATLETRIELASDARFLGWELLCLGRPACDERFAAGACEQRFELSRAGRPVVIERTRVQGGSTLQAAPWGLGGRAVTGTLLASPPPPGHDTLDGVRALAAALPAGDRASATLVDGALVCRFLGDDATRGREHFTRVWRTLRPAVIGRPPTEPRIWLT